MDLAKLLTGAFLREHPEEAVRIMERYRPGEVIGVLDTLTTPELSLVFANVLPAAGAAYLELLDPMRASAALDPLPGDTVLRLLRPMKPAGLTRLLDTFPEDRRETFLRLLAFPGGTAGSVMDPFTTMLTDDLTVDEALHRVRNADVGSNFYPYVVDRGHRLVGRLTVSALMLADPGQKLGEVVHADVVRIPAMAAIGGDLKFSGSRTYQSLPVVDDDGVLVGVVTPDRLTQEQTGASGLDLSTAAADVLISLSKAYWDVLSGLITQTATLLTDQPRSRK